MDNTKIEKYSPKWLYDRISECENEAHSIFYILEFGRELVKNCNLHNVSNNEVAVCPDCNSEDTAITGTDTMMCLSCGVHWTN